MARNALRDLETTPRAGVTTALAALQWLFFMFANTVVIPISVGHAFGQAPAVLTASLERSFMYTGLACLLQAIVGHRLPLMEGPSGLWWGVILSLAATAQALGQSVQSVGGNLEIGIIISGLLIATIGAAGLGPRLQRLFSPVVMGAFFILLAAQLILIFFKGMIGLSDGPYIEPRVSLLSFAVVALVMLLSIRGGRLVSQFAILIGVVAGWVAYRLLIPSSAPAATAAGGALLALFPWGTPAVSLGLTATIVVAGLINTTNTVATLQGAEPLFGAAIGPGQYRRSFIVTGCNVAAAGLLGLVPYAPYTSSIGFLRTTRILERTPFLLGSAAFILLGAVPALGQFFATLPVSVGDAVLFVAYLQLFGSALASIQGLTFSHRTIYRIAAPVLCGLALMALPPVAFQGVPALARSLVQSGLVMGILLAILLDRLVPWEKYA